MSPDGLNEREFELINIIGDDITSSQRDLSRHLDLSLGLTNMLIRRLVTKGYIRISQLNKRKVKYLLTPKGFAEKMRKSVKYTIKTIASIGLIKEKVKNVILELYDKGERNFVILGKSDFAFLVEFVFKDLGLSDYKVTHIDDIPIDKVDGTILICKEEVAVNEQKANFVVDLINELAKDNAFVNHADEKKELASLE